MLLEYVKHRDPRYQDYIKKIEEEREAKRLAEQEKKAKIAEEARAKREAYLKEVREHNEKIE